MNFGELDHDENFKSRLTEFHKSIENVGNLLDLFCSVDIYDSLEPADKVRYDLFQSFAIDSLFWFYLRTQGVDPSQHELKSELNRVKEYMSKSKKLYEKKTIMPHIDKDAAKRFVKSSLWVPKTGQKSNDQSATNSSEVQGGTRKRKRESDEDSDSKK